MTQRLYYTDSYQIDFNATVLDITTVDDRPAFIIDQTYFYPTSGGQLHDTGVLGDQRVIDVIAAKDGTIRHVLETLPDTIEVGQPIHGAINWPRRYDHMQQHSGQHLLSQIFHELFGYETMSVHFGADLSTLDLAVDALTLAQLDKAETCANDIVYASLPIKAYFVDEDEIAQVPLRRPPKVSGTIRIVEIDQFDYSACGGTHCRTTAEIGPIKLLRQERRRGQSRVTFVCGRRALADYTTKHQLINQAANLFNNEPAQVPELITRNLEQVKLLRRQVDDLIDRQLPYEVKELLDEAHRISGHTVIAHTFDERDVDVVKKIASLLQERPKTVALLGTTVGGKLTLVFARADEVDIHVGNLLRASLTQFGGKGGGRPDFAQGGGVEPGQADALLKFAAERVAATVAAIA